MADFFDEPAAPAQATGSDQPAAAVIPASLDVNSALNCNPGASQDALIAELTAELATRGVDHVAKAEEAVNKRTADSDAACKAAVAKLAEDGAAFLAKQGAERDAAVAVTAAAHRTAQAAEVAATADMEQGGELWTCVNAVTDVTKPNKHCAKNTETMRRLIGHLKDHPNVKA